MARVGGDEFALVLPGVGAAPTVIAARLRRALERVVTPSGLRLRSSVGAATCPPRGDLDDAVRAADASMYDDKRARRGGR
ncbi:hypothetical protein GCM10025868_11610 [Angustibacter aerolatus]|uniref:GGDEF domain-containing protein n=1 Tax=Angustibacter aerolatus TaxID=1162965 RepID=A0ABQ6JGJ6_9ACTN|nr:diguanylate cyclase [Angustibacter aerolatus]GMA85911.1 hypothetical protein GCM10025868_11610 [Angustibacter aerolatus]